MASCHKKSMSIIFEIPLYHISFSFENRYLQDITRMKTGPIRMISITYLRLTYLCDLGKKSILFIISGSQQLFLP